ncbi:MAG TPA: AI-2E family transporter [Acidimicrobiales bacterium]|nr:AI-2E family transporter [Acidimicrobiales bacterium]
MSDASPDPPHTRLALSGRSIALIVLTIAVTGAVLGVTRASARVLGWMAAAASIAALIEPLVVGLSRFMRRGVAVLLTFLLLFGLVGGIAFFTINDVVREVRVLERVAPERAHALEKSKRFGSAARSFKLEQRTRAAVKDIPQRLRGGSSADALRSAGTRGVAYLATTVLTVFLVLNGRKLVLAGIDQIEDDDLRATVRSIIGNGGRRAVQYATGTLAMSASAGMLVGVTAKLVHVPGAVPLGLWAALWDVVPLIGAVAGALPVALLSAATSPTTGVLILLFFLVYEAFEAVVIQKSLERRTVHVGPFLTLVVASAGLELYGLGGALFALFATSVAIGLFEEWRKEVPPNEPPPRQRGSAEGRTGRRRRSQPAAGRPAPAKRGRSRRPST